MSTVPLDRLCAKCGIRVGDHGDDSLLQCATDLAMKEMITAHRRAYETAAPLDRDPILVARVKADVLREARAIVVRESLVRPLG